MVEAPPLFIDSRVVLAYHTYLIYIKTDQLRTTFNHVDHHIDI
jgi:hypothetical protein